MNSAQRRKSKREFPHTIKLVAQNGKRYFEHDEKVNNARKWCDRNFRDSYRVIYRYDNAEFKFTKEKDAVIFALKWL